MKFVEKTKREVLMHEVRMKEKRHEVKISWPLPCKGSDTNTLKQEVASCP